ncbi:hypothetical protein JOE31_002201 [Arthrobacter sp. PvP023]|uniref:hypothetical protein n=1 Tax=Micrococcaceae TaxID=1268 RepID=UPI001AE9535F|nr:hypothetical protein [Arthrobacter sp. PvP023]MBP1135969.1 hypothetical protein [Arthrobacter sp. PvP023]
MTRAAGLQPVQDLRKRRRRRLLLGSAVPGSIAVALAVKLLSVGYLGGEAAGSFGRGDQAALASAASGLGIANIVERHKAPFAAADALVLGGDYDGARVLFEAALADAPPADECKVRVNLVLSIERLADKAVESGGSGAEAGHLYGDGLAAVKAAPPGCFNPQGSEAAANGADGEGDRLREAEQRLQGKADKLGDAASGTEPGSGDKQPQPDPEPQQSQLDKLAEQARSAQRERNGGMQRDEYLRKADTGSSTDKPW